MANTNNARRLRAVKRTGRRSNRRDATAAIRRGDYDDMASGSSMRRVDAGRVLDDAPTAMSRGWEG